MLIKKRRAFTLLETIISLTIFCSLVIVSFSNIGNYYQRVQEHQAIEQFKNTFNSAFNYCYLNKKTIKLYFNRKENSIEINISNSKRTNLINERTKIREIKFPKTLKIVKFQQQYTIHNTGFAAPMTIELKSQLTNKVYLYKIQMGWGEIVESST